MNISGKRFTLSFPITRQHCGLPLGNGDLGVLLFGGGEEFQVELSLSGCWDHRFSERFEEPCPYRELVRVNDTYDITPVSSRIWQSSRSAEGKAGSGKWLTGSRVAGGRFRFQVSGQLQDMTLDYETGLVRVETTEGGFELGVLPGVNQLLLSDADGIVLSAVADPMWNRLSELYGQVGYRGPELIEREGLVGWFQPMPGDPGTLALARHEAWGWQIGAQLSQDGHEDLAPSSWVEGRKAIMSWWRGYWERQPGLQVPDDFINRFFVHALYKFGAATMPTGLAAGLQGPWLEDYQRPPWSCDYHFNVNVQQVYTLAFMTGNLDHLEPLFTMLESAPFQAVMRQNARMMFGIEDGLLLTHAVDDRGWQVGWMGPGATLDFACGGWTALLYWWRYLYSGDRGFLRDRAMPFMRGIMRVYEEALEEHEGRLSLPLSISAEYGCTFKVKINGRVVQQNTGRDPSSQLACIHALTNGLLEGSRLLGEEPKPIWLDIKKRLPHLTAVGEGNDRHIGIWEGQDLDVCHRHHSHLSLIYPFDITTELSPEEEEYVTRGIDHWILRGMGQWSEWCYPWAIQIQTRRGFQDSPTMLFELWRKVFVNEGLATTYLPRFQGITAHRKEDMLKPKETHEVMQLDGTMAGATAMMELLVHQCGGVFHLFSGIPDSWQDASVDGVYLPNQWRLWATRKGGVLVECVIRSGLAGTVKLALEPGTDPVSVTLGEHSEWRWVR